MMPDNSTQGAINIKYVLKELKIQKSPAADNADKNDNIPTAEKSDNLFSALDLVDILSQIDELRANVAIRKYDGILQLCVNDTVYEIAETRDKNRYHAEDYANWMPDNLRLIYKCYRRLCNH